jgi:hypothetical protein
MEGISQGSFSWDELRLISEREGKKLPQATHPSERPEIVGVALEMIDVASQFYANTDFAIHEAFLRLKSLSPEIKTDLHFFFHERELPFTYDQDGKTIARTLTEFVNDILIQNGRGSPSDEDLELLFCMDP